MLSNRQAVFGSARLLALWDSSGARWITFSFQLLLVTATTFPVPTSVICAMMPPSPICWLRSPMYSSPELVSLKSLASMPMVRGYVAVKDDGFGVEGALCRDGRRILAD